MLDRRVSRGLRRTSPSSVVRRFALGICATAAMLATLSLVTLAAQATVGDRARMSLVIADYLHLYGDKSGLPPHVVLSWAVVERPWALIKWHSIESPGSTRDGVLLLKYAGSQWHVEGVSATMPPQKRAPCRTRRSSADGRRAHRRLGVV